MSDIIHRDLVLKLNASWQGFETCSVQQAVTFLCSESGGKHPGFAMDYDTELGPDGVHHVFASDPVPVPWEEWIELPVRHHDLHINASGGRRIRVPLVVICAHYSKLPTKTPRLSNANIHARDGYIDQYTGEKLSKSTASVDHVVPLSRGGKNHWTNMVSAHKRRNQEKGNRLNEEIGYRLIRPPAAPKSRVKILTVDDARHPFQVPFLIR